MLCRKSSLRRLVLVAVLLAGSGALAAGWDASSIQFDGKVFKIAPWAGPPPARGWPSLFAVYAGAGDIPPMIGAYETLNGALVFRPAYPIAPGMRYRVLFRPPGSGPIERSFDGPRRPAAALTHVLQVYPSGDVLPSNQLRLYIYFSAPMSRGQAARYIHIQDERGKNLEGPRSPLLPGEELWDPNFQRLTLTFDPGRIKRGLKSNRTIGPPIAQGKRYTLTVDRDWPDAQGAPLQTGFRKMFRGGPALRLPPDPRHWRLQAPSGAGALVVSFPTPMNFALLQRMLRVTGPQGAVAGTIAVARGETEWRFTPRAPWKAGAYRLVVDTGIEDLAGNHVGQAFDLDRFERVTERIESASISLPFTIR